MNTMVYDDKEFRIWRQDTVTIAMRPHGVNRIEHLTVDEKGEITVISRCYPWLHDRLKWKE